MPSKCRFTLFLGSLLLAGTQLGVHAGPSPSIQRWAAWTTSYNNKHVVLAESPPPPSSPSSSAIPSLTPTPSVPQTSPPPRTTKSEKSFNPSDVPTVWPSSTAAAQKPGAACTEESQCNDSNTRCDRNQTPACDKAAQVCKCLALPATTPKPTSTTTTLTKNTGKAPYPVVTQWIKDMEIKVGEQKCNDKASFDKEKVSGMDILMDIQKICKALDEKKLRISPDSGEYKSNGLGSNGSKHHFSISWIQGCTFPSKERTKYGMRAFDPRETQEEIDGMNRCEYMLSWNWKECDKTNSGKGGYRDIGCLRYATGPGEEGTKGTADGIKERLKELAKDLGPWETIF
ncbi:hypothetical protein BDP81DRAFT_392219 [Colletotrichum phormii]|uniref:Uncharacterized protein n=1 Tax=Colletotrichum phormii TaxID=359342 RepID=A0AAJ0EH33_9PEZI|nr:uncharacterized protein BDP81DRAFT_392219 [Colletotrichum phormii]KAK1638798.1 hypothetical protein BDP81DRAFT_392219 [Colletotrichum phormii]